MTSSPPTPAPPARSSRPSRPMRPPAAPEVAADVAGAQPEPITQPAAVTPPPGRAEQAPADAPTELSTGLPRRRPGASGMSAARARHHPGGAPAGQSPRRSPRRRRPRLGRSPACRCGPPALPGSSTPRPCQCRPTRTRRSSGPWAQPGSPIPMEDKWIRPGRRLSTGLRRPRHALTPPSRPRMRPRGCQCATPAGASRRAPLTLRNHRSPRPEPAGTQSPSAAV